MNSAPGPAPDALYQQAHACRAAGDLAGALAAYQSVSVAAPKEPGPHHWIGIVQLALGEPAHAEAAFRKALELEPGRAISLHGLGTALVGQGRFAEGFPLMEARHRIRGGSSLPPLPYPRWSGEDLKGKHVLIWSEEGFGDQIQFARYAPQLAARGAKVSWYCAAELADLFAASLDIEVIKAEGSKALPNVDAWIPSSSLAAVLPSDDLPSAPYLRATPRPTEGRIGVVAFGNPKQANDANRSLPPELRPELLALPGAISLKPEDTGARHFLDTAEIVAGLDLVVTVDSAVAHLAGALGKPCWVLLPRVGADWRWMTAETTTPWYPTLRLFRQPTPGDWTSVLERVRTGQDG